MSKLKLKGDSGGTGVFTLTSPNSNTDRTITLPDDTGNILTSAQTTVAASSWVIDEDNMASDLATKVPTQQSVKAYVDAQISAENTLAEDNDVNLTSPGDGALLIYDTGTSTWRDGAMSGDATISDTGALTIANDAIDSQHYAADSIDAEHYAAGSVDGTAIANDAVDSQHIAADSIDAEHYAAGSVDGTAIGNDQVDSQHYVAGSIDNEHLAANSVDSDNYVDASIDLAHMSVNSIDSDQYVDG